MPRTSVCFRRSPESGAGAGFTLLELLVVLALVAIASGLVVPAALRGIESARERGAAADLRNVLDGLPVRAFQRGNGLEIDAPALRRLLPDLPEEWQLDVEPPLRYEANGVAAGGRVRLLIPGRATREWRVAPVSGAVVADAS